MSRVEELIAIMARLRDPEGGCPWDLEQDFASISPHTIEEAYEVDEAILSGDLDALRDELGDLLFQVVFQARLAEELGAFDFEAVAGSIVEKLVRRHPHVFAEAETPTSVEGQRLNWEDIKAAERAEADEGRARPPDPFFGIPRNLPALARSAKIAGRVERLSDREPVTVEDLVRALAVPAVGIQRLVSDPKAALHGSTADPAARRAQQAALIGDGLRAWVRMARALAVDPEQALRQVEDEAVAAIRRNHGQEKSRQIR